MATKRAIVIGSGAGGSMAARALARSGKFKVTIFEKGTNYFENLTDPTIANVRTRFSNDELKFGTRNFINPDPLADPRSFRTSTSVDREFVGEVNTLPQTVGGGLNHADWKARRVPRAHFPFPAGAPGAGVPGSGPRGPKRPPRPPHPAEFVTPRPVLPGAPG